MSLGRFEAELHCRSAQELPVYGTSGSGRLALPAAGPATLAGNGETACTRTRTAEVRLY
jgi:hypothetical protein